MAKPKIAFYWSAGCGGCEESILDLNENLLRIAEKADIVFWPMAFDFRYGDIEAMTPGSISASFITGAVRLSEQKKIVTLLREKSHRVVAMGSCAHIGGILGLGNLWDGKTIFNSLYKERPTVNNPEGVTPDINDFYDTVKTLDQVISVDYYLPGCPPPAELLLQSLMALLKDRLPAKGTVLAPGRSLCVACPRQGSKPEALSINQVKRVHEVVIDRERCFLDQGIICLGPATRSGCGEKCIKVNIPCRGCFGPTKNVIDQGGAFLSALASILGTNNEEEIEKIVDSVVDPAGTFYRFSLPSSLLQRKRIKEA